MELAHFPFRRTFCVLHMIGNRRSGTFKDPCFIPERDVTLSELRSVFPGADILGEILWSVPVQMGNLKRT